MRTIMTIENRTLHAVDKHMYYRCMNPVWSKCRDAARPKVRTVTDLGIYSRVEITIDEDVRHAISDDIRGPHESSKI